MIKIKKHHTERAMTYQVRKDFVKALKQKARREGKRSENIGV